MMIARIASLGLFVCFLAALSVSESVAAQTPRAQTASGTEAAEDASPEQVIVQREAVTIIDPLKYQVPLRLLPSRFVTVVSPRDGVIDALNAQPGGELTPQSELFRLESEAESLHVKHAESLVELHQLKLAQAKKKDDAEAVALAEAELKVANVALELANYKLEQAVRRTEFDATVFRVYAIEGQFVVANQKILEIGDPSVMQVEIPVNREDAKAGEIISFQVEGEEVEGKIVSVLPALDRFEPLRDLYDSLASARVEIDNASGDYKMGQAVYVSSIPRENVAEVENSAITAGEEGQRKVQVIRENVVRDLPINVLAPVGADRSYISGPFLAGDELILSTSQPLADGTQLAPKTSQNGAGPGNRSNRTQRPKTGF